MDAIRAFIAIELPPSILDELGKIEAHFRPRVPDGCVRWVKPDSIHLTLKFLGQVPSDQIELITASLRTAIASHHAFTLEVAGAGCFPNLSRPRVVWVGVKEENHPLHALQRAVENAIAPLGYPTEQRDFTPHLTLGRVARDVRQSDLKKVGEVVGASRIGSLGRWEVKHVALIKSDLQPTGAVYTILAQAPLVLK